MRELSLNEVGMVRGGAGPVGAVAGATAAGALTGSGFGMVAKGTQMAVSSIRAVQTTSNTVRAGMGTGAVSGTVDGLTQAVIKGGNTTNKDKAGTNYQ